MLRIVLKINIFLTINANLFLANFYNRQIEKYQYLKRLVQVLHNFEVILLVKNKVIFNTI